MKHILNNISRQEKNSILEQYSGGKRLQIENFSKLVNSKLGDVKTLISEEESMMEGNQYLSEDFTIDGVEDFDFPEDPNNFNKWHIEELLKVYDVDEANEILNSHYPEYSLEIQMESPHGKSIGFMSPEGDEISGRYIVGCCGGRGSSENMDRFKRSDDAFYEPRKRY